MATNIQVNKTRIKSLSLTNISIGSVKFNLNNEYKYLEMPKKKIILVMQKFSPNLDIDESVSEKNTYKVCNNIVEIVIK